MPLRDYLPRVLSVLKQSLLASTQYVSILREQLTPQELMVLSILGISKVSSRDALRLIPMK